MVKCVNEHVLLNSSSKTFWNINWGGLDNWVKTFSWQQENPWSIQVRGCAWVEHAGGILLSFHVDIFNIFHMSSKWPLVQGEISGHNPAVFSHGLTCTISWVFTTGGWQENPPENGPQQLTRKFSFSQTASLNNFRSLSGLQYTSESSMSPSNCERDTGRAFFLWLSWCFGLSVCWCTWGVQLLLFPLPDRLWEDICWLLSSCCPSPLLPSFSRPRCSLCYLLLAGSLMLLWQSHDRRCGSLCVKVSLYW